MTNSLYTTEEPAGETFEPFTTVGGLIVPSVAGKITHLKWFCGATKPINETTLPFVLYDVATQAELARAVKGSLSADGWNIVKLTSPISRSAGQAFAPSVYVQGQYTYTSQYHTTARVRGVLTSPASDDVTGGNGRFHSGSDTFPESTFGRNNYWTDVVYVPDSGPKVSVWSGTEEVPTAVYVWNGTAEVPAVFDSVV